MPKKYSDQIKIPDCISDPVFNAVSQCNQFETEETLTTLSDDEVGAIRGGLKIKRSDLLLEFPPENRLKI